nr:phosphoenolpyruvate kinase [Acidobacteriota bacterium]
MRTTLDAKSLSAIAEQLRLSNQEYAARYPGETGRRQPVHTVYGGAHLFKAGTTARLGTLALRALEQSAPDAVAFAKAVGLSGAEKLPDSLEQSRNFQ